MRWFNYIFKNTELPLWLRRLNYISLAGVVAWPLIAFGSLFMFDDPNGNYKTRMTWFILLNLYPAYLLLITDRFGQQLDSGEPAPLMLYADSSDVSNGRDVTRVRVLLEQYGALIARLRACRPS